MAERSFPEGSSLLITLIGIVTAGIVLERLIKALGQVVESSAKAAGDTIAASIPNSAPEQTTTENPNVFVDDVNPWRGVDPTDWSLPDIAARPTVAIVEPGEPIHP